MSVILSISDIRRVPHLEDTIERELSIEFHKSTGKKPIIAHKRTNEGNIVCPLDYGLQLINKYNILNITDVQRPTTRFNSLVPLRPEQEEMVNEILQLMYQTDENGNRNRTALLAAFTSAGKTMMATHIAQRIGMITLVVLINKILIKQWISEFGFASDAIIMVVGDSNNPHDYYYRGKKLPQPAPGSHYNVQVIICMIMRLRRLSYEVRSAIGLLIMDEAHQFCTIDRCMDIMEVYPENVLLCTATPDRDDGCTKLLPLICGDRAVTRYRNGTTTVQIIRTPYEPVISYRVDGKPDWTKAKQSLYYNKDRNDIIVQRAIFNLPKRTLIMVDEIEHANILVTLLRENGIDVCALTGKTKEGEYYPAKVIVATHHKAGTGFDEGNYVPREMKNQLEPIEIMLIVFTMKMKYLLSQFSGRIRTTNPIIQYMRDIGDTLTKHYNAFLSSFEHITRVIVDTLATRGDNGYEFAVISEHEYKPIDSEPHNIIVNIPTPGSKRLDVVKVDEVYNNVNIGGIDL